MEMHLQRYLRTILVLNLRNWSREFVDKPWFDLVVDE